MNNAQLRTQVEEAIRKFWKIREDQGKRQGKKSDKDHGSRSSVTGGRQLDGFIQLFTDVCKDAGIQSESIKIAKKEVVLPGYFRPTKQ